MTRADGLKLAFLLLTAGLVLAFGPGWGTLGAPVALFGLLVVDGVFRPGSGVFLPVITRGDPGRPQVALTFDDGPDPAVTPRVLDALRQAGAKATFFVIGRHVKAHPELAARILAEGHQLENHSFAHPRALNFASASKMAAQITAGAAALAEVPGARPSRLYRPPVGLKSPPLARAARRLGVEVVLWSLHARDTRGAAAGQISARVLGRVRAGDIVLMHDGSDRPGRERAATADALPAILRGLADRGLQAVTVDRLRGDQASTPRT